MKNITEYIDKVVAFIEENIKEKISLEDISEHVYLSKFYIHRIMTSASGRPLMDYVRARKLAESIPMLTNNYNIMDVSKEYSFEFEQSYIKAFKKEYGITPNKFIKGLSPVKLTERLKVEDFMEVKEGVVFKPKFVFKPSIKLVGTKHYFSHEDNWENLVSTNLANDFFNNQRQKIKCPVNSDVYIGFTRWKNNDPKYNMYMTSLEVKNLDDIPDNMEYENIGAHKYAVFKFIGGIHPSYLTVKHINDIKGYIYWKWLRDSEYQAAQEFEFEYIDASLASEDYCEMDVYVPVKKK